MKSISTTAVSALVSAALVAAHGFVDTGIIGGVEYKFYQPYQDPYTSPLPDRISRPIQGNGPVEDLTIADIQCGGYAAGGISGSEPAKLHAKADAGSTVTLNWTLWPESHVGPVITYMARCPDAGCQDWMPGSEAVWFKVQEGGREGTSNNWAATPLMTDGNAGAQYTIPSCLQSGYYLVRHEIIALHAAYAYPGAQFYPGCHQLEVSGSGSTVPSSGLVGFPGAYKAEDAGITYDPYKAFEYKIPGPALFSCSGSGTGSGGNSPAPSSQAPAPTSAASTSRAASSTAVATSTRASVTVPSASATVPTSSAPAPTVTSPPIAGDDEEDDDLECPADDDEDDKEAVDVGDDECPADDDEDEEEDDDACPIDDDEDEDEEDDEEDCPAEPIATPTPAAKFRRSHPRDLSL